MNKKGQKTREHIKNCAAALFAEKGFKQVTMKDICEAARLSRGGLYCHYDSTRQIFQEMISDMMDRQDRSGFKMATIFERFCEDRDAMINPCDLTPKVDKQGRRWRSAKSRASFLCFPSGKISLSPPSIR